MTIVIKTIKKRRYRYYQHSVRVGGKVKTSPSLYLGPESAGFFGSQISRKHGIDWEQAERDEIARLDAEKAKIAAFSEKMHALYGMNLTPTVGPVEKTSAPSAPSEPSVPSPDPPSEQSPNDASETDASP